MTQLAKDEQPKQPVSCPLCFSPLTSHETETNHTLEYYASGEVRGVLAGKPTLHAVCLKGCIIHVQASVTTEFLFKKEAPRCEEEKPPTPRAQNTGPYAHLGAGKTIAEHAADLGPPQVPGAVCETTYVSPPAPRTCGYERDPNEPEQ